MSLDVTLELGGKEVYTANITHNLNEMAESAFIYKHLWRPEELGITKAGDLVGPLCDGLKMLVTNRDEMEKYNPPNKWGSYEGLCKFVFSYALACSKFPTSNIRISR